MLYDFAVKVTSTLLPLIAAANMKFMIKYRSRVVVPDSYIGSTLKLVVKGTTVSPVPLVNIVFPERAIGVVRVRSPTFRLSIVVPEGHAVFKIRNYSKTRDPHTLLLGI